ncbi:hypothetical protein QTP88_024068 [Uroleucon formosanum]
MDKSTYEHCQIAFSFLCLILGPSQHTKHTEPFFADPVYNPLPNNYKINLEINEVGQIMNLFEPINHKASNISWRCNVDVYVVEIDGVSCYANASLQMIFNCHYIINQLVQNEEHSALTKLAKSYLSQQNPLNSIPLRRSLGQHFNHVQQQDAAEFINALLCHSDSLKNCLKHELISILTCLNCYDVRTNKTPNYILPLAVTENKVTLNSLFNEFSKEIILEINCSNCRITGNHSKVMNVSSTRQYLCIQLQLWNELQEKMHNVSLISLSTTSLKVDEKMYRICSAICHHGESLHHGHYTSLIKKSNLWFRCNDLTSNKERWPRGGKDIYMLILEKQN